MSDILSMLLVAVFICVGIALVVVLLEVVKILRTTHKTISNVTEKIDPLLANVDQMTQDIMPAVKKVDPLVDRVQLTLDAVNLEMMRVDEILEDVTQITDTASSATAAVDNITNAPIKAVNNVATRVRTAFNAKQASPESAALGEKNAALDQALEDYRAAQVSEGAEGALEDKPGEPNLEGFEKIVADTADAAEDGDAPSREMGVA